MSHVPVYEGGMHTVYCDGLTHYRMVGGTSPLTPEKISPRLAGKKGHEFPCDCERYKND